MGRQSVYLVSGWGHSAAALEPAAKGLVDAYEVKSLAVHALCGGDGSGQGDLNDGLSEYAASLKKELCAEERPSCLVGWSMGAMVALELACKFPQVVEKLVLLAGTAKFVATEDYPLGVSLQNLRELSQALRKSRDLALLDFFSQAVSPLEAKGQCQERLAETQTLSDETLAHGLKYLEQTDLRPLLSGIGFPTLLIHGKSDEVISWRASEYLSAQIAESELLLYDHLGHDLLAADEVDVILKITQFFSK